MKEESQVETIDINHNSFLFPEIPTLIPIKMQIAILIEPLFLFRNRYIVEYVNLRWYFSMMRDQLYFFYIDYPIKLQCYLLRIGTETTRLPSLRSCKQKRRNWVLLLLTAAWYYLEFQFTAHCYVIIILGRIPEKEKRVVSCLLYVVQIKTGKTESVLLFWLFVCLSQ